MPVPFLDLQAQYQTLKEEIDPEIHAVLNTSTYILGPAVEKFERAFAEYCNVRHCIGVSSGTSAIELILRAYGIGHGDEVITVTNSFFASAEAISLVGATPVLVDCRESDALMNIDQIERVMTKNTKAILPVHLYGQPADMDDIMDIANRHNILLIEDACQAHGSVYKGRMAGSLGHAAAFSFYPGKNLGAYGEAGGVTTDDDALAQKIRILRDHGMPKKYHHTVIGNNARMDGIQGAVLSVKLRHLDAWNAARRKHAKYYRSLIGDCPNISLLTSHNDRSGNEHLFVIRVNNGKRDALRSQLEKNGIQTGLHYPVPIHLQPAYADRDWKGGELPIAENLSKEILSLPMYAEITTEQVESVCHVIMDYTR